MKPISCLIMAAILSAGLQVMAQEPDSATAVDSLPAADATIHVDVAAQSYAQKCAGCHTVGGGKLTGPDLLPTRAWPKSELFDMIQLMEPRVGAMSSDEINAYIELLQDSRAGDRIRIAQELASKAVAATLEPASKSEGQRLYDGTTRLANGGIACITCHRAGAQGGTFGPDLTNLHARMGKVAMTSAIQQTQYPVMSGTYKNRPVTAQEAVHLAEYLTSPELMPVASVEDHAPVLGASLGVIGLLIVVGLYRKRSRSNGLRQRGMA